jgi:hypothetical protein
LTNVFVTNYNKDHFLINLIVFSEVPYWSEYKTTLIIRRPPIFQHKHLEKKICRPDLQNKENSELNTCYINDNNNNASKGQGTFKAKYVQYDSKLISSNNQATL